MTESTYHRPAPPCCCIAWLWQLLPHFLRYCHSIQFLVRLSLSSTASFLQQLSLLCQEKERNWCVIPPFTLEKRTRMTANKPQSPPMSSPPSRQLSNIMDIRTDCKEVSGSSGLTGVMDLLIDISSHLEVD